MTNGKYRSYCGLCHMGCGIIATVENNKITKIEGDPEHPGTGGKLCPKSQTIPEIVSSPDRLTMPKIRRSRDEALKEVSWDEALDFAAERLTQIRNKYGSKSVIRCNGAPVNYECRDGFKQFMEAYGSDAETGASNLCSVARGAAYNAVYGARPEPDPEHTNLLVIWASNPMECFRTGNFCSFDMPGEVIRSIQKRGAKVAVVDPVYSDTAKLADEWINLECGSDSALILAMMNYIIANDLYDHEFCENYTVGFEQFREHVKQYTPEWAAEKTGLTKETICSFAREYAMAKPASISDGNGTDMYNNVCDTTRCIAMLEGLCGYVDVYGGNMLLPHISKSRLGMKPTKDRFGKDVYPLFPEVSFSYFKNALLAGNEKCPKALIAMHANPVLVQANENRTKEALSKLEFIIDIDIFPTATGAMADVVFPDLSPFERWSYKTYSSYERPYVICGRPLADPPGEARTCYWIESELAKRMNLDYKFSFTDDIGHINYMLEAEDITFEQIEKAQYFYRDMQIVERKYKTEGFYPDGGLFRFYSKDYENAGFSPMPVYREPTTGRAVPNGEYPLICTTHKPKFFVHSKLHNTEAVTSLHPAAELWISQKDADDRKIRDNDAVTVVTEVGSADYAARIKENLKEGMVVAEFGWGNPTDGGPSMNMITNDYSLDPISGAPPIRKFICQVKKKEGTE